MGVRSWNLLKRLAEYVDSFADCFGRKGRPEAARRYVKGLVSDAKRKNMQCMWSRISDRGDYQALQHFITHSTWSSQRVWGALRRKLPDQEGVLIVDDTGIPKRGTQSVGVARQYSGTLGKIGTCQVVVSIVLRSKHSTWPLAMELYLPDEWTEEGRRHAAAIPEDIPFRTKWEIALNQIDQACASGIKVRCVTADAAYGDIGNFRKGLAERGLYYAVAVKVGTKAFDKPPRFVVPKTNPKHKGPTRIRLVLAKNARKPKTVRQIAKAVPEADWETVTWRRGSKGQLRGEFVALRVTPSHAWGKGNQHDECWLLCERSIDEKHATRFYFSNLPASMSLKRLVDLARTRWPIEQSYEQLKDELALDHFEGRSYPGFHHHLVLTALAFAFLQLERRRSRAQQVPTLNRLRLSVTELVTAQLFASDERLSRMITEFIRDPPDF